MLALVLAAVSPSVLHGSASAAAAATAARRTTVATATWAVVLAVAGTSPSSGPLTITWAANRGATTAYVDLVNVGSTALSGAGLVVSGTTQGQRPPSTVTVDACIGSTWVDDVCTGTVVRIGSTTIGTLVVAQTLAPQARLAMRVTTDATGGPNTSTTISVRVTRSQVAS